MPNPRKDTEPESYQFLWVVHGYDCGPSEICSPHFKVNFEVTEWCMKLDLTRLQNIGSCIPFKLCRVPGLGPSKVTFDVKIIVERDENKSLLSDYWRPAETFGEKDCLDLIIRIDPLNLESKDESSNWLASKDLYITVEFKSVENTDIKSSKKCWEAENAVLNDLKTLHSSETDPVFYDLVLKFPGKEFKLHKCILNARWLSLASFLEIKSSDKIVTKDLPDEKHEIIEHLLNFAYYGDLTFMHDLSIDDFMEVFSLVKKYNFFRLNNLIAQLAPKCNSSQLLQSYRTSISMKFTNVTSTETAMGDFRTCNIELKPSRLRNSGKPMTAKELEKYHQHIRFMDLRLYVDKGPLGYNWLMFSIVLGKIPKENPVNIQCKLYVVDENKVNRLLTEQHFVFNESAKIEFSTPFKETNIRYKRISEPVITWEELTDEKNSFMHKREVTRLPSRSLLQKIKSTETTADPESSDGSKKAKIPVETVEEKDIHFRFEIKLSDGEYVYDIHHGTFEFKYKSDKIFQDLELMSKDKFTDIEVYSGVKGIQAHKVILAARSPKISKVLLDQPSKKTLEVKIQPEYLERFIGYFYTGRMQKYESDDIEHLITVAIDYGIISLAELLQMEGLKHKEAEIQRDYDDDIALAVPHGL